MVGDIAGAVSTLEGNSYTLDLVDSDPTGNPVLSWDVNWGDGVVEQFDGTLMQATHIYDGPAQVTITASATDGGGSYSVASSIGLTIDNVDPTITLSGDNSVIAGHEYSLSVEVQHPVTDTISSFVVHWGDGTSDPLNLAEPTLSHVYSPGDATYTISTTVTDGDGEYELGAKDVYVFVPLSASASATSVDWNEGSPITLSGQFTDPGYSGTHSFAWEVLDLNSNVVATSTSAELEFTPTDDGQYTAVLTVTNALGDTSTDEVELDVNNVAPVVEISCVGTANEGDIVSLSAIVSDLGSSDTHDYYWVIKDLNGTIFAESNQPNWEWQPPNNPAGGYYQVLLSVVDDNGASASANAVPLYVSNVAPTVNGTVSKTTISLGESVVLDGSFFDPSPTDTLTYYWTGIGPSAVIPFPFHEQAVELTPEEVGVYTLRFYAEDNDGGSNYIDLTLNVLAPVSCEAIASSTSGFEGDAISLGVNVVDEAHPTGHTYHWQVFNGSSEVIAESTDPTFFFQPENQGVYTAVVTVTNEVALTAASSVELQIENAAPQVEIQGPYAGNEGEVLSYSAVVEDAGVNDSHAYLWEVYDSLGALVTSGDQPNFDWTPTNNGSYTVQLTVSDELNSSDPATLVVSVANVAPAVEILLAGADPRYDVTSTFTASVTDPGTADSHTYIWTVTTPDNNTVEIGSSEEIEFTPTAIGDYTLKVAVHDSDLESSEAVFAFTVYAPLSVTASVSSAIYGEGVPVVLSCDLDNLGYAGNHSFSWEVRNANNDLVATSAEQQFEFTPPDNCAYTATLVVSNILGENASDEVTFEVVPQMTVGDVEVVEGSSGVTNAVFTVTLSGPSDQTVTVNFSTENGTAAAPGDYFARTGTLTFSPGVTTRTVTVPIKGDTLAEGDESLMLNLTNASGAEIVEGGQAIATILDDDATPIINVSNARIVEGNSGTSNLEFVVSLSSASGQTVTAVYATTNDSAVAGEDYTAKSGTLTFAPGVVSLTVTIVVQGDLSNELDEQFHLDLSEVANAQLGSAGALGTIVDNDALPSVSVANVSVDEAAGEYALAVVAVSLSEPSGREVTVPFSTSNGTAAAGEDYDATSGTLTFSPGATSQAITVLVRPDQLDEWNETFRVNLGRAANANLVSGAATVTIVDTSPAPELTISDVVVTEGDESAVDAVFAVTLSSASAKTVYVTYSTSDGAGAEGASASSDYAQRSGTLTFLPGVQSQSVTLKVRGDVTYEYDEQFSVNLSAPVNATLADAQANVTLLDNDTPPTVSIGDISVQEGNSGTQSATFTVTLSAASGRPVLVTYGTVDDTAGPGDYVAQTGTLTFAPGTTTRTVTITLTGDALDEVNETFQVSLVSAEGASLADTIGVCTIYDNDAAPSLSVSDVQVSESSANVVEAHFTVSLSAASGQEVTVVYQAVSGAALEMYDYAATEGTLTFAPGVTSQAITVLVMPDAVDELAETFAVRLSSPTNSTIADAVGTAEILDDNVPPTVSIADTTVQEGSTGSVGAVLTLTLSEPSGRTVVVNFATSDGSANSDDYVARTGMVTFAPGETSKSITVAVRGDLAQEFDETFHVDLVSATGATIDDGVATVTIYDNDLAPTVSIAAAEAAESSTTTSTAVFNVALSAPSGRTITVTYTTSDDTAIAGSDYTAQTGTLTFAPGTVSQQITITVLADSLAESSEDFNVELTSATEGALLMSTAVGTILDSAAVAVNAPPTIDAIANQSVAEGALLTFVVTGNDPDSATGGLRFSLDPGAPAGATISESGLFVWRPVSDQVGGPYTITVRVTDLGTPARSATASFTVTVSDVNEAPIIARIENQSISEGQTFSYAVVASDTDEAASSLSYSLEPGAPEGATISEAGVINWTAGEDAGGNSYTITVRVTDHGAPALSATRTFVVHVDEVDSAPVIEAVGDRTTSEGSLLTFVVNASDEDSPSGSPTFSLDPGAPIGASISASGVFSWTPGENDGGNSYQVTIRATDATNPSLSTTETITITVAEVNQAPVMTALLNQTVTAGQELSFTVEATDADAPANTIMFSLDEGAPAGATISADGVFTWTPAIEQGSASYTITIRATDDGSPALSATQTITINVLPASTVAPSIEELQLLNDTGVAGDRVTTDASLTGFVTRYAGQTASQSVQYDLNGDGLVDGSITTSNGQFVIDLSGVDLPAGPTTIQVRAGDWNDDVQSAIYGAWRSINISYVASDAALTPPTIEDLTISDDTGAVGDNVTSVPVVVGRVSAGDLPLVHLPVQYDLNGDGSADGTAYSDFNGAGNFRIDLRNRALSDGPVTIHVRAGALDPTTQQFVFGEWVSLSFTYDSSRSDISLEHQAYLPNRDEQFYWFGSIAPEMGIDSNGQSSSVLNYQGADFEAFANRFNLGQSSFTTSDIDNYTAETTYQTAGGGSYLISESIASTHTSTSVANPDGSWTYDEFLSSVVTVITTYSDASGVEYVINQSSTHTYTFHAQGDATGASYTLSEQREDNVLNDWGQAFALTFGEDGEQNRDHTYSFEGNQGYTLTATGTLTVQPGGIDTTEQTIYESWGLEIESSDYSDTSSDESQGTSSSVVSHDDRRNEWTYELTITASVIGGVASTVQEYAYENEVARNYSDDNSSTEARIEQSPGVTTVVDNQWHDTLSGSYNSKYSESGQVPLTPAPGVVYESTHDYSDTHTETASSSSTTLRSFSETNGNGLQFETTDSSEFNWSRALDNTSSHSGTRTDYADSSWEYEGLQSVDEELTTDWDEIASHSAARTDDADPNNASAFGSDSISTAVSHTTRTVLESNSVSDSSASGQSVLGQRTVDEASSYDLTWSYVDSGSTTTIDSSQPNSDSSLTTDSNSNSSGTSSRSSSSHEVTQTYPDGSVVHTLTSSYDNSSSGTFGSEYNYDSTATGSTTLGAATIDTGSSENYSTSETGSFNHSSTGTLTDNDGAVTFSSSDTGDDAGTIAWVKITSQFSDSQTSQPGYELNDSSSSTTTTGGETSFSSSLELTVNTDIDGTSSVISYEHHAANSSTAINDTSRVTQLTDSRTAGILINETKNDTSHSVRTDSTSSVFTSDFGIAVNGAVTASVGQTMEQHTDVEIDSTSDLNYSNDDQSVAGRNILLTHTVAETSSNSTSHQVVATNGSTLLSNPNAAPESTSSATLAENLTRSASSNSSDTLEHEVVDASVADLNISASSVDTKSVISSSTGSETLTFETDTAADGSVTASSTQTRQHEQTNDVTTTTSGTKGRTDNRDANASSIENSSYASSVQTVTTHTSDITAEVTVAPAGNEAEFTSVDTQSGQSALTHTTTSNTSKSETAGGTMTYTTASSTANFSATDFDKTDIYHSTTTGAVTETSSSSTYSFEETGMNSSNYSDGLVGASEVTAGGVTTSTSADVLAWNNSTSHYSETRQNAANVNNNGQASGTAAHERTESGTYDRGGNSATITTTTDVATPGVNKTVVADYNSTSSDKGTFGKSSVEQTTSHADGSVTGSSTNSSNRGGVVIESAMKHDEVEETDNRTPGIERYSWEVVVTTSNATTVHGEGLTVTETVNAGVTTTVTVYDKNSSKVDAWANDTSKGLETTDNSEAGVTTTTGNSKVYSASGTTTTTATSLDQVSRATDGTSSSQSFSQVDGTTVSTYENSLHDERTVNDTREASAHTFEYVSDYSENGSVGNESHHSVTTIGNQRSEIESSDTNTTGTFVKDASTKFNVDFVGGGRTEVTSHEQTEHRSGNFTTENSSDRQVNTQGPNESTHVTSRSENGSFNWSDNFDSEVTIDHSAEGITRTASTVIDNNLGGSGTFTSYISTTVTVEAQAAPDTTVETEHSEDATITWDKSNTQNTNSANAVDLNKVTSYTKSSTTTDAGSGTYSSSANWVFHHSQAGLQSTAGISTLEYEGSGLATLEENTTSSANATDNQPGGATIVSTLTASVNVDHTNEYSFTGSKSRETDGTKPVEYAGWALGENVISGETTSSESSSYEYDRTWESAEDITQSLTKSVSFSKSASRSYDETHNTSSSVAIDGEVSTTIDLVVHEEAGFTWDSDEDFAESTLDESVEGSSLYSESRDRVWTSVTASQVRDLNGNDLVTFTEDREQGEYRMASVANTVGLEMHTHESDITRVATTSQTRTDTTVVGSPVATEYEITHSLSVDELYTTTDDGPSRSASTSKTISTIDVLEESRAADGTGQIVQSSANLMNFESQYASEGQNGPGSKYHDSNIEEYNLQSTFAADILANGDTTLTQFDVEITDTTEFTDHMEIQTATVDFIQDNVYTTTYSQVATLNNTTLETTLAMSREWVRTGHMATNDGNGNVTWLDLGVSPGPIVSGGTIQSELVLTNFLTSSLIAGNWSGIAEMGSSALLDEVLDALGDTWTDTVEFGEHPGSDPTDSPVTPNATNPAAAAVFYKFGAGLLDDFLSGVGGLTDWWSIRI